MTRFSERHPSEQTFPTSPFQRVLDAQMAYYRDAIVEQLNRPLWFLGPQPDHTRAGWPQRYVLFPRVEWLTQRRRQVQAWRRDRLAPAFDVLRTGLPECDPW